MDNNNNSTPSESGQAPATPSAGSTPLPDNNPSLDSSAFTAPTVSAMPPATPVTPSAPATPGQASPVAAATPPIPATHTNPPIPATPLAPVVSPAPIGPTQTPPQPQASATAPAVPARNLGGNLSPEDVDLIRAYVGTNYDEISTNRFSWPGFCFGPFYLFYRKAYGYACLLFLAQVILSIFCVLIAGFALRSIIFFSPGGSLLVYLLIFLVDLLLYVADGFLTNRIYLHAVKRKVAKIKAANPTASHEELKTICASKGGTSIPAVVIAVAVTVVGVIIFIVAISAIYIRTLDSLKQRMYEMLEQYMPDSSIPGLS